MAGVTGKYPTARAEPPPLPPPSPASHRAAKPEGFGNENYFHILAAVQVRSEIRNVFP